MAPEFSVVIPSRGDSPHLRAALGSALANDVDLEVLLVHDRRSGESPLPRDLATDSRVRRLEVDSAGPAGARNTAIEAARGAFVAFLDDDDLWLREHLGWARETLAARPDAILTASGAFLLDDRTPDGSAPLPGDLAGLDRFDPGVGGNGLDLRQLLLANRILTPTVVMVRERLAPGDRFRTDLSVMEDYDLWLRLARRHELAFDPRPSVVVRRRRGSASRDLKRMASEGLEVVARFQEEGIPAGTVSAGELRTRVGRLWHDLAYACLVEDDVPTARWALRESVARLPLYLKNYMYVLAGVLPGPVRRGIFARGRRMRLWLAGPDADER